MRIIHSERMAVETEEQREARLRRMRSNQSERLAAETEQQRGQAAEDACQSKWEIGHWDWTAAERGQADRGQQQPQLLLLEQPSVQAYKDA